MGWDEEEDEDEEGEEEEEEELEADFSVSLVPLFLFLLSSNWSVFFRFLDEGSVSSENNKNASIQVSFLRFTVATP